MRRDLQDGMTYELPPALRDLNAWLDNNTITGRAHPPTSFEAARSVLPHTGTARYKVLVALLVADATDEEIQQCLGMSPNTERPRRKELVDSGYVEATDKRRLTSSGRQSIVWRATMFGRTAAAREYLGFKA